MLEIERGSTGSHSMENSFWKSLSHKIVSRMYMLLSKTPMKQRVPFALFDMSLSTMFLRKFCRWQP